MKFLCLDFWLHTARSLALVILLVGYWTAAQPDLVDVWLRVLLIGVFGTYFLFKVLVLMVSLPVHRLPPEDARLRHFFVSDYRKLAIHIAEVLATVIITGLW